MKTNESNRSNHSSKHDGNKSAVLPTADSAKNADAGNSKSDQRDMPGKNKDANASKDGSSNRPQADRNADNKR
jgi:hypothetical protein